MAKNQDKEGDEPKDRLTDEFFKGLKEKSGARAYILLWISRRLIFITLVFVIEDLQTVYVFLCLFFTQIIY